jgi:hypothetical protein
MHMHGFNNIVWQHCHSVNEHDWQHLECFTLLPPPPSYLSLSLSFSLSLSLSRSASNARSSGKNAKKKIRQVLHTTPNYQANSKIAGREVFPNSSNINAVSSLSQSRL